MKHSGGADTPLFAGAGFGHAAEHLFSLFLKEKLILLVSETIFMQFFGGCR